MDSKTGKNNHFMIDTSLESGWVVNSDYIRGLDEVIRATEVNEVMHKSFLCVRQDLQDQDRHIAGMVNSFNPSGRLGYMSDNTAHFDSQNKLRLAAVLNKVCPMLRRKVLDLKIYTPKDKNLIICLVEFRQSTKSSHIFIA